jgi:hypothetical protein
MVLTTAAQWLIMVRPLRQTPSQHRTAVVSRWLDDMNLTRQPILTCHTWVAYFLGIVEDPLVHKGPALLAGMPVGTIVVWDSLYCPSDYHRIPLELLDSDKGHYERLNEFGAVPEDPRRLRFVLFRKIAPTPAPSEPDRPYPPSLMTRQRPEPADRYYQRFDQ